MNDLTSLNAISDSHRLFGVPVVMTGSDAASLLSTLEAVFSAQIMTSPTSRSSGDHRDLAQVLNTLRHWFDPVAKGERVREALSLLPRLRLRLPHTGDGLVMPIPDGPQPSREPGSRMLLTPEGAVVMHCLRQASEAALRRGALPGDPVELDPEEVRQGLLELATAYRTWNRQRIDQVVALLTSEPSTLRPAAAGLLLVLLVNRNTSPERALPRPSDLRKLDTISAAVSAPALAYARTLTGSQRASESGVDLYRGWALGELTRRLGPSLHTSLDEGIFLDSHAEAEALRRLADDVARRPPAARERVEDAVDAALSEYATTRPVLAALALAHDRPSNTRRIRNALVHAARTGQLEIEP